MTENHTERNERTVSKQTNNAFFAMVTAECLLTQPSEEPRQHERALRLQRPQAIRANDETQHMKITSIKLRNFRCFGPDSQTISLETLTAFVGDNGTGKSAVLHALRRMFGIPQSERQLERLDFHIPADLSPAEQTSQELQIEVRIDFPELESASDVEKSGVSTCFRFMAVDDEGGRPYCCARLTATWAKDSTPEGTIDERIEWITSPEGDEETTKPLRAHERSRIHILYVPATRNPSDQLRSVSRGTLHSLLLASRWSQKTLTAFEKASATIQTEFEKAPSIAELHSTLRSRWSDLYDGDWYSEPRLEPVGQSLNDLLRKVSIAFQKPDTGSPIDEQCLSDGLRFLLSGDRHGLF